MADVGLMDGVMPDIPSGFSGVWDGRKASERPQIVIRRFYQKSRPDPDNPQKLTLEDWVEWGKPGLPNWSTNQRINMLKPRPERGKSAAIEWEVIGPAYEAWKKGEEAPIDGTPLFAWPGIPREIADSLKGLQIRTVEELAMFPDDRLGRMPFPGMREWKQRAQRFVEAAGDMTATGIADKLNARDEEIEALKRREGEKDALLAQMSDRLKALEAGAPEEPKKRGPGRPRKNPPNDLGDPKDWDND